MKLVGYVRVSTEKQSENTSLGEQRNELELHCKKHEHELIHIFEDVQSGKDAKNRSGFQDALKALDNADGLIATKLDRLARSVRDLGALVEDVLQPKNKALICLDINVDTSTATGIAFLGMMAVVATLERDTINKRTQAGRTAKAASGGYIGGQLEYGQSLVNGQVVPNEDELKVIEIIRKHRKSGKNMTEIAKYLNTQGIASKTGKEWTGKVVGDILKRLKAS